MGDYREGTSNIIYPERIKGGIHAQAFDGVICGVLDDVLDLNQHIDTVTDISLAVTRIIEKYDTVDWQTNRESTKQSKNWRWQSIPYKSRRITDDKSRFSRFLLDPLCHARKRVYGNNWFCENKH